MSNISSTVSPVYKKHTQHPQHYKQIKLALQGREDQYKNKTAQAVETLKCFRNSLIIAVFTNHNGI